MKTFVLAFCLTACAYGVNDSLEEKSLPSSASTAPEQRPAPEQPTYIPAIKDPDACVPETFAADAIPYGFVFDPSCPPNIYAPPRWIPPWDKGPVMRNHQ